MDQFDRASELEARQREAALAQVLRSRQDAGESALTCIYCGVDIPQTRRRAVPGCQRCVDCQEDVEMRHRMRGGRP